MRGLQALLLLLLTGSSFPLLAQWSFNGHAKLLYTQTGYASDDLPALLTGQHELNDFNGNLRLNAKGQWQHWDVDVGYQLVGLSGDSNALPATVNPFGAGSPGSDAHRLFALSAQLSDDGYSQWFHRLDRLSAAYATDAWVLRVGRQAVSWGNGISFHPLDIFNPFSPLSLDTEYKNGDDLLYVQWLLNQDNDLQFIYQPRRDIVSGELDSRQDSTALKLHRMHSGGDWDLLLARHYNEDVYGVGHVRDIGGAVWRTDVNVTHLTDGRDALFVDSNIDYSWNWFKHNIYGYFEWFHNSLGQERPDLLSIDAALLPRLQRGELYTLGRNELALGAMVELDARWQANLSLLHNLGDGSGLLSLVLHHDWLQDAKWMYGARLPIGGRDSEYGGLYLPTVDGNGYVGAGRQLFAYIQYYY